ncbi:MAG: NAD-dependent deacylase [Elusimicrobiota bacterium]|jgi:NAD-dependent deacetylase|nr:NAD-dependent deacylase [Elusimicrobiota bacterium]
MKNLVNFAVEKILNSKYCVAFTGAGISVESGILPFRGENGIWNRYEEKLFDINYFRLHPQKSWSMLCDGFYEMTLKAKPNRAHIVLSKLEKSGFLKSVITQNIDNLHRKAGSKTVYELHGNASVLCCAKDGLQYSVDDFDLKKPPRCLKCNNLLKPNFVFFGEMLPEFDMSNSVSNCRQCDVMIIIGSTGTVYPAASLPGLAKQNGSQIIEINIQPSAFTDSVTDVFISMEAGEALSLIETCIKNKSIRY